MNCMFNRVGFQLGIIFFFMDDRLTCYKKFIVLLCEHKFK